MYKLKPLTQIYKHEPEKGIIGDCFRTCIAMLIGYNCPEKVPHFVLDAGGFVEKETKEQRATFKKMIEEFLTPKGLRLVEIPFAFETLDEALDYHAQMNPSLVYMLTGTSANNCNHCIVCIGGTVFKDPAQDASGIVGPASDGFLWTSFLAHQPRIQINHQSTKGS